jgi:branched-chain amino acid transport system ATP-binding protein
MLAIARALVADNRLLLIDEPSEGLAPVLIEQHDESHRSSQQRLPSFWSNRISSLPANWLNTTSSSKKGALSNGKMKDLVEDKATIHRYLGAA